MAESRDSTKTLITRAEGVISTAHASGEACLVVIYGPALGQRLALGEGAFEIGRSSKCDLPLDEESVSRQHARITKSGNAYSISDLGSTNGTYVNDVAVMARYLADGDQIKIGRSIIKFMTGDNVEASYHEEIYRLMTVDALTDLFNRRYFTEALEREFNRCLRYKRDLSLLLMDVDHFKQKNDQYGHLAGDSLLRQLAAEVKPKLRREDVLARVGGEEFAALLPEIGLDGAKITAEKVRAIVEAATFRFESTTIPCTISIGIATLAESHLSQDALYGAADAALYRAKESGRNRVMT